MIGSVDATFELELELGSKRESEPTTDIDCSYRTEPPTTPTGDGDHAHA
ncbi:hypothetical protein OB955_02955 [Halobacteria archaeon AArc-m2/3/4]|uniref:Uncharacterized protein n=1 Tax=Natronoglomus mannanivorans TaxID=2979990 RepID=A0ABT2Q9V4_9EURY|nr:hypothetical protein [Halobacteria archaeon AArc-m2/3/4]